jgi:hypothetical protein
MSLGMRSKIWRNKIWMDQINLAYTGKGKVAPVFD